MLESEISLNEQQALGLYIIAELGDVAWGRKVLQSVTSQSLGNLYTDEEKIAMDQGYEFASKVRDVTKAKECPYCSDTEPVKASAWADGFYDYFYPG